MKRIVIIFISLLALASCRNNGSLDIQTPDNVTEHVDFCADVSDHEGDTKLGFDYQGGMYIKWEGDEKMDVYIRHNGQYSYAGRISSVPGSLSDDGLSLKFAGSVIGRPDPANDIFVFVYTNSGVAYDWTKQTLDMTESKAGTNGLKALKNYTPIVFTPVVDSNGNTSYTVSRKSCYIKFSASGLTPNVSVTSLSIYNSAAAVFPKTFDLSTFDYQSTNKSKTLSYVFENLHADENGCLTVFLAAPIISSISKNYEIHIVTEDDAHTISTLSTTGITSASALSQPKVYNLNRGGVGKEFVGSNNPATTVGQTQGGSSGASDVVVESIIGQWDKTGYLSNDVYGVLELGKPENLTDAHNSAINSIQYIYRQYWIGTYCDMNIHFAAVRAAGRANEPEWTGQTISQNGPQYVDSYDNTGTFNNIVLTKDTEIFMTFVDSKAWNTNTVGYYCYTGETDSEGTAYSSATGHKNVHDLIVFPSTSQSTQDQSVIYKFQEKTTAQLLYPASVGEFRRVFPAGTTIGFIERVNSLDTSKDFSLKPISNDSPVHYTNIAWNQLNTLSFSYNYWNQIAVLKLKMPTDNDFNRHALIYAMKDQYRVTHWTNPILLIYTSEPDAIDFERSKDYWTEIVEIESKDVK